MDLIINNVEFFIWKSMFFSEQDVFLILLFCNILNVFTVISNTFNAVLIIIKALVSFLFFSFFNFLQNLYGSEAQFSQKVKDE